MTRKLLLLLTISLICILMTTQAYAKKGLFGVGARFAWENYKKPILVHAPEAIYGDSIDANSFGSPNFGGELQVHPLNRLSVGLAIDMGFSKHEVWPLSGDKSSDASFFTFGVLLGAKFYVFEPEVQKATLYLHLAAGKYFSKAKNSLAGSHPDTAIADQLDAQTEVVSKLSSPVVIQFAVGAEFFAAEAFSIGADILGFRMGFSKASVSLQTGGVYSGDHKLVTFSVYSALTLNFGFGSGGRGDKGLKENNEVEDAWGSADTGGGSEKASGGAAADSGWGASGGTEAAGSTNDGWGTQPADQGSANGSWGAQPADQGGTQSTEDGWEAQPAPAPTPKKASGGGGGGGGGGGKSRGKAKSSSKSAPPPPPPGY
jgi:hypothetical protein